MNKVAQFYRELVATLTERLRNGERDIDFGLEYAKKQGSARKPVILAFLTVCGIIFGMQLLLPAVFGGARLKNEICPVLPLLEGADLPGNVLARFDVIWMGFLVFGLLFSLGSLFHYGNQIAEKNRVRDRSVLDPGSRLAAFPV
mgnify:CR=1 FL=1